MIYGYARVSTKLQEREGNSLESQEQLLKDKGAVQVYKESFTGSRLDRPQLNELIKVLAPGDTLIVTKLDRLARSASKGIIFIDELLERGINVHVLNMGLIDSSPTGKLIRTILLAFAEFERDMIVERTQEGRKISGRYGGRHRKFNKNQLDLAMTLLSNNSYKQVSAMTGISVSTLTRTKQKYRKDKDTASY